MTIVRKSRVIHKCKICEREIPIGSTYCGHTVNKTCKWVTKNYHISCMLRKVKDINPYCEMILEKLIMQMNSKVFIPIEHGISENITYSNIHLISTMNKDNLESYMNLESYIKYMHEVNKPNKIPKVLLVCHRGIRCNQEYNPHDQKCCYICTDINKENCSFNCVLNVNECKHNFIRIE